MSAYIKLYRFTANSPGEVSFGLRRRGVTHTFMHKAGNTNTITGSIKEQPVDVILALGNLPRLLPKRATAVLLFGHAQEVVNDVTDIGSDCDSALRWMLHDALVPSKDTSIQLLDFKPHEHIERVSPPSFLDRYNTVQCKITPYSLRQEAHKMAMGYLSNAVPQKTARKFFNTSLKLEAMAEIVLSPRAEQVKKAVSECSDWTHVDAKAAEYGFERFEIMYVIKSYAKLYGKDKK